MNAFVPRDDESTWHIQWFYDATHPVDREHRLDEAGTHHDERFFKLANNANWYGQDRAMMKTTNMSGIVGIALQDHAVSETMGKIADRTREHLGRTDMAVVAWRRLMLKAARELEATGRLVQSAQDRIDWTKVTAQTFVFPVDQSWKDVVPLAAELQPRSQAA